MSRSPEVQAAIDAVNARPCKCVTCGECRGTGNVFYAFPGQPHGQYLGSSRWDDLDEMEPCESCHGGIVEMCERCRELDDLYADEDHIFEGR